MGKTNVQLHPFVNHDNISEIVHFADGQWHRLKLTHIIAETAQLGIGNGPNQKLSVLPEGAPPYSTPPPPE